MKFVHAADLHLDSPLLGLPRYDGAPHELLRGATRRAFERLIDFCLEEPGVSLLVLAGDIYDGDWRDYSTGLFFAAGLARLRAANVQVVMVRGNHDAQSQITSHLRLPENVRELSYRQPESYAVPGMDIVVHGQSFATRAVTEDLSMRYPRPAKGALNIGLLHTSAGGHEGHENYAPCQVESLVAHGYDYWALGHVHRREVLATDPHVVFSGNLQGRHMRETGPKGATLVTIDDDRIASVEHRALDVVRWCKIAVDLSESSVHDVLDAIAGQLSTALAQADGRPIAARIELIGATPAHATLSADTEHWLNQVRALANDLGEGAIFVEQVLIQTRSLVDLQKIREQNDALGQLARSIHELKRNDAELGALLPELGELRHKLPPELREGAYLDGAHLHSLLDEVEHMLIARLLAKEAAE